MMKTITANRFSLIAATIIIVLLYASTHTAYRHQVFLYAVCFLLSLYTGFRNYKRLSKISNAPISTIAGAAQGYIELHGTASTLEPLKTPYLDIPCVWYKASVYANREGGSDDAADRRLLNYTVSDNLFQLKDRSGICMVNPKGAEVMHVEKQEGFRQDHRYVEEYLPANKPLYIIGHLDTKHDYLTTERINTDVAKKLGEWKKNQGKLLAQYDSDRNDELSLDEWENARKAAKQEVVAEHQQKASNDVYTLSKPAKQLFLISALSPEDLRTSFKLWTMVYSILSVGLFLVLFKGS